MKFIVNARFLTQEITGVQRFAIEISKNLKRIFKDQILFVSPKNILHKDIANELGVKIIGSSNSHIWEQIELRRFLYKNNCPLLLNLCNTAPLFYRKNIVTIHDVAFEIFPENYSRIFVLVYRYLIPKLARAAKKIITVSEFSKSEIAKYYNIPENKISVVYNAVSDNIFPVKDLQLENEKYFLALSSFNRRKNFSLIIDAFQRFQKDFSDYKLYIIGDKHDRVFSKMNFLNEGNDDHKIIFLGRVNDDELGKFYTNAQAFLYPSLYEGFGIPPLEAQKCGTPIILSDIKVFKEIFEKSALFCDPYDASSLQKRMIEVINVDKKKQLSKDGVNNSTRYDWEKNTEILIKNLF